MQAQVLLSQAIQNDRVAHAYLLEGASAQARMQVATNFAKAYLCQSKEDEAMFQHGSHPDFHVLDVKEETIKIRDHVVPFFQDIRLTSYSGRKIYIITDAEKMNTASQNSILKTLEEPVKGVVILLLTANSNALLTTILSRVVRYPVTEEATPFEALEKEYQDLFFQTMAQIESPKPSARITLANEWANKKDSLPMLLDTMVQYYRNSLVEQYTNSPVLRNTPKTDKISAGGAIAAIQYIEDFRFALKSNANVQLAADVFLTKLTDAYK